MNKLAKKFLDDEMYLSEEEKSVKEKIEESLSEFFRLHDQLTQNKIKIDQWNVAIIFKRFASKSTNTAKNSKRNIDEISLQMIDQESFQETIYDDK